MDLLKTRRSIRKFEEREVEKEKKTVGVIIAIGYPDEIKTAYDEEQLPIEKIHYNKF